MNRFAKCLVEKELKNKLGGVEGVAVLSLSGVSAIRDNQIRRRLFSEGLKMTVVKNTLAKRATAGSKIQGFDKLLNGQSAVVYGNKSIAAVARTLLDEKKKENDDKLELRGVVVDGEVYEGESGIELVANLPTKEEVIGQILALIVGPGHRLANTLTATAKKTAALVQAVEQMRSDPSRSPTLAGGTSENSNSQADSEPIETKSENLLTPGDAGVNIQPMGVSNSGPPDDVHNFLGARLSDSLGKTGGQHKEVQIVSILDHELSQWTADWWRLEAAPHNFTDPVSERKRAAFRADLVSTPHWHRFAFRIDAEKHPSLFLDLEGNPDPGCRSMAVVWPNRGEVTAAWDYAFRLVNHHGDPAAIDCRVVSEKYEWNGSLASDEVAAAREELFRDSAHDPVRLVSISFGGTRFVGVFHIEQPFRNITSLRWRLGTARPAGWPELIGSAISQTAPVGGRLVKREAEIARQVQFFLSAVEGLDQ